MPLPIDAVTLFQVVGIAVLVFLAARSRPAPMQNGSAMKMLLEQVTALQVDRDKWKDIALRLETKAQELERDCQGYRAEIRRRNEDDERRRRELR